MADNGAKSNYEFYYTLEDKEIVNALRTSGLYKNSGKRAMIETIILGVMAAIFLASFFARGYRTFDVAMGLLSLAIIFFLNWYPRHDMKKQASKCEKNIKLRVYTDKLYVYMNEGDTINIDLRDSTIVRAKSEKLISIMPKGGGILVVPEGKIPPNYKLEVINILLKEREENVVKIK